jgi:hypothetical protein
LRLASPTPHHHHGMVVTFGGLLLLLLMQLSVHLVTLVLTLVQKNQIGINIYKRYNSKTQYKQYNTKHNKYKTHGEKRDVYRVLMGKSEGKRPLGRPRRR